MPGEGRVQGVEQLVGKGLGESQGLHGTGTAGMEQSPHEKYLGGKHIRIWWLLVRIREREGHLRVERRKGGGKVGGPSDSERVGQQQGDLEHGAWTESSGENLHRDRNAARSAHRCMLATSVDQMAQEDRQNRQSSERSKSQRREVNGK